MARYIAIDSDEFKEILDSIRTERDLKRELEKLDLNDGDYIAKGARLTDAFVKNSKK